jgi:hypothetical protein
MDQQLYNHACWVEDIVQGPSLEIQDLWLTINTLMRRVVEIEEYLVLQAGHQPIALYSGSSHVQVQHIGSWLEPMLLLPMPKMVRIWKWMGMRLGPRSPGRESSSGLTIISLGQSKVNRLCPFLPLPSLPHKPPCLRLPPS